MWREGRIVGGGCPVVLELRFRVAKSGQGEKGGWGRAVGRRAAEGVSVQRG